MPTAPARGLRLHLFLRHPRPGAHSIEMLYRSIAKRLEADFRIRWIEARRPTRGLLPRLLDALGAAWRQGDINHVTGDSHYQAWFLRGGRTVLTIHDFVTVERLRGLHRWLFLLLWYRWPVARVAAVVVISEATRNQLHRHLRCGPAKVHLIPNPVDGAFRPRARPFDPAGPRILHVGTAPNKNLARHLEALRGLPCRLVVLGCLDAGNRALLDGSGIAWEGHSNLAREDVAELYAGCDLLLFASTYEGFGMPIIEAQATGLPVITADRWSMPEVAGGAALLVDPESVDAIRAAVRRVIEDHALRARLVRDGFANARRFDADRVAGLYADLYRSVAERPR